MITLIEKDKVAVLAALYNASDSSRALSTSTMTVEEARELLSLNASKYYGYFNGRPLKIDLSGDEFNPYHYNVMNGSGAAEKALARL